MRASIKVTPAEEVRSIVQLCILLMRNGDNSGSISSLKILLELVTENDDTFEV